MPEFLPKQPIDPEDAINVCKEFYEDNNGDEATTDVIINIFAELFNCSPDTLVSALTNE